MIVNCPFPHCVTVDTGALAIIGSKGSFYCIGG
uniref:Aspartate carbamoyltransferase regulatory subunit n=2 Tax=unclassified Caudoviricetes TaxID=2788787 RepID=A0A8S5MSL3_9CAUD|nr:MAG TPA: aspartate carbamoyltransferase regulatory subunit [Siphoviridae sp. ctckx14]DAD85228.1 MAG TPA: aspartate carbamoyltransferase regulatory subunit [Siphoviridae sp. ctT3f41]DAM39895.1 MAG TPA: aspartate carbamoyltransferase regulatory subunit [Caudoviricetes sp.]DAO21147.1 MAG TPA: aspartate carbamoyltransferase regulatory subunit [Caudoviricetes sp.]DAS06795.1 MAG TPA: aspartate carbamoyltransferase regulatory subunit [Caudoviricetes sp.]